MDLAQEVCKRALLQNKSCSQAWEILGLIFEKEDKYDLAADAYAKVRQSLYLLSLYIYSYISIWLSTLYMQPYIHTPSCTYRSLYTYTPNTYTPISAHYTYKIIFVCIQAWKLEFELSASVGFKLAFSYLKCKKFLEAIDVCDAVLNQFPDYPRISEEILKKAQNSIRVNN